METKEILKLIGGQAEIARFCQVSEAAVSRWVKINYIPHGWYEYLRLARPHSGWDKYKNVSPNTSQEVE